MRVDMSIRSILLVTVSVLSLLILLLSGRGTYKQWQRLNEIHALKDASYLSDGLLDLSDKLAIERHVSFSILHAPDRASIKGLKASLQESRQETDKAFETMLPMLDAYGLPDLRPRTQAIQRQLEDLRALRKEMDGLLRATKVRSSRDVANRLFSLSTDIIVQTQSLWMDFIKRFVEADPVVNAQMSFKYLLLVTREYTGRGHTLIGSLIVENAGLVPQEQAQLLRWQGIVAFGWSLLHTLADEGKLNPLLSPYLKDAESDHSNIESMVQDIFYMPTGKVKTPYPINAELWLELTRQATDSLYALRDATLHETQHYVASLDAEARQTITFYALIFVFTLMLCAYSFVTIITRVIRPINNMVDALVAATEGKIVPPARAQMQQQDEIGKLSRVLYHFQQNYDELKRSNRELDNFAYIASHDLREPLRGLSHQAGFLLEDYKDKLDETGVGHLNNIVFLSQHMNRFIHDLLYYSQLGRSELMIEEVDLNDVIDEIRDDIRGFIEAHRAQVVVPQTLPCVSCDRQRITEVFTALIRNGVIYNDKPEPRVEIGVRPDAPLPHGGEGMAFYVKDNGIGIKPEFQDVVFRIFKRLRSSGAMDETGTGAGLTFVKKIIERHDGRIWLESAPGVGTTFYFTLNEGIGGY